MKRRHLGLAVGGAAALAAGVAFNGRRQARQAQADGGEIFALRLPRPDGSELDFATLRGRPLVINFWATWCVPCIRELPALNRFARDHASRGWQVVGIAVDNLEPVQEFLRKLPVEFPVALAGASGIALSRQLGNSAGGLPFTLAVGADGRVRQRKIGETNYEQLAAWATAG